MAAKDSKAISRKDLLRSVEELRSLLPEMKRLTEEAVASEKLQAALFAIADLARTADDMHSFYTALHDIVGKLMYAENFYITLIDGEKDCLKFPYFADTVDDVIPGEIPVSQLNRGLTAYLIRTAEPLLGSSARIQEMREQGLLEPVGTTPMTWLGVPMLVGGELIGAIVVQSYIDTVQYGEAEKELLNFVAQHIATVLERRRVARELEKRVAERTQELSQANRALVQEIKERKRSQRLQATLFQIAEVSNQALDMGHFYTTIHQIVSGLTYAEHFAIGLCAESGDRLLFPYRHGRADPTSSDQKARDALVDHVLKSSEPLLADRPTLARFLKQNNLSSVDETLVNWLGVPLVTGGSVIGVLTLRSYDKKKTYAQSDLSLLTFVSHHIASALERFNARQKLQEANERLEQGVEERTRELHEANRVLEHQINSRKAVEKQLLHDALHDALTNLPNRNLFMDRLIQAFKRMKRSKRYQFAVLFLDLDCFKVINDSLGHLAGDTLLQEVSRRIQTCMRDSDTVARFGGDEFAILLDNINDKEEAGVIAKRVRIRLGEPFSLEGQQVFTSTSIGIAMANRRYRRPEDMLRDADSAMYRAKETGRNRHEFFDESMYQRALSILKIENDIKRAITNEEFEVRYQPIIRLEDGFISGFEALARWRHPQEGLLAPDSFLQMAHETGLVLYLDWSVMAQACRQWSIWRQELPNADHLMLNLNITSKHFFQKDFATRLQGLLEQYQLPPRQLLLEINESALLDRMASIKEVFLELKQLGVQVLLDEFGSRYTFLGHFHQFPIDTFKINKSFVLNMLEVPENKAIVKTLHILARTLNIADVVEGIETKELLHEVLQMGCHFAQGNYLCEAVDAGTASAILSDDTLITKPKMALAIE